MLPDLPTQFIEIDKQEEATSKLVRSRNSRPRCAFKKPASAIHCISQLLRDYGLYERDKEYVVQGGKVNIVDQNTGRVMPVVVGRMVCIRQLKRRKLYD